jgi:hypothetical protein
MSAVGLRAAARSATAVRAALALGCVLVAVGCGVTEDRGARLTPAEEVPFGLLEPTATTTPASGDEAGGDTNVCLALDGSLLVVGRARGGETPLASLRDLVLAGPTEGEADLGLRTAMGDDTIEDVSASGGLANVDLTAAFTELPGDQQLLALAQITCTLTAQPGVSRVEFELDGARIEVPIQGGSLVERPVTRADYRRFIAN